MSGGPLCSAGSCFGYLRAVLADDGAHLLLAWQAAATERVSGVVMLEIDD